MKALIISEEQKVCDSLNTALQKAGYDTIVYKWLLKALDNIEEIRPDCIVVSSSEYPRHWKTLVQFVKSGIGGEDVQIYLYEPKPMSAEDEEKAKILGINDYFTSLDADVLEGIFGSKSEETVVQEEAVQEEVIPTVQNVTVVPETTTKESENAVINTGHFMFTNPLTLQFISGKYFDYNGKTMSCSLQSPLAANGLEKDCVISSFTFFDEKCTRNAKAVVNNIMNISSDNTVLIVEISEIYEEI